MSIDGAPMDVKFPGGMRTVHSSDQDRDKQVCNSPGFVLPEERYPDSNDEYSLLVIEDDSDRIEVEFPNLWRPRSSRRSLRQMRASNLGPR